MCPSVPITAAGLAPAANARRRTSAVGRDRTPGRSAAAPPSPVPCSPGRARGGGSAGRSTTGPSLCPCWSRRRDRRVGEAAVDPMHLQQFDELRVQVAIDAAAGVRLARLDCEAAAGEVDRPHRSEAASETRSPASAITATSARLRSEQASSRSASSSGSSQPRAGFPPSPAAPVYGVDTEVAVLDRLGADEGQHAECRVDRPWPETPSACFAATYARQRRRRSRRRAGREGGRRWWPAHRSHSVVLAASRCPYAARATHRVHVEARYLVQDSHRLTDSFHVHAVHPRDVLQLARPRLDATSSVRYCRLPSARNGARTRHRFRSSSTT